MMTPIGRHVLVRSIDRRALINAMAWVSMPAMIGPLLGPPLGGFITTYATSHWIFLINVPMDIAGIILVTRYIEDVRSKTPERFDLAGMVSSGLAVAGLTFGVSRGFRSLALVHRNRFIAGGAVSLVLHLAHAAARLIRFSTGSVRAADLCASVIGGFMFRIGVGAMPLLVPLLFSGRISISRHSSPA